MKTFYEWLTEAMATNQPVPQQPRQISLGSFAQQVDDPNWHQLYDYFSQIQPKHPNDPTIQQLGMALYQSAQNKNYNSLQPFVAKYIHAQPLQASGSQFSP